MRAIKQLHPNESVCWLYELSEISEQPGMLSGNILIHNNKVQHYHHLMGTQSLSTSDIMIEARYKLTKGKCLVSRDENKKDHDQQSKHMDIDGSKRPMIDSN
jgi:hypothetical protein